MTTTAKARFISVDKKLRRAFKKDQPSYAQLLGFTLRKINSVEVRSSIEQHIAARESMPHAMMNELVCLNRVLKRERLLENTTPLELACEIKRYFTGKPASPRKHGVGLAHSVLKRISPPAAGEPVFDRIQVTDGAPPLFTALNLYLVIITAHPFADGNGRSARVALSATLAALYGCAPHHIPFAELTRATEGIYEELVCRGDETGDYQDLVSLLLDMIEEYTVLLDAPADDSTECDLVMAMRLAAQAAKATGKQLGINQRPPYPISVQSILNSKQKQYQVNQALLGAIVELAQALGRYGEVVYALAALQGLARPVSATPVDVTFFLETSRKDELVLNVRALRERHLKVMKSQFAVITGDPVLDAKLLIDTYAVHNARCADVNDCLAILCELDCP